MVQATFKVNVLVHPFVELYIHSFVKADDTQQVTTVPLRVLPEKKNFLRTFARAPLPAGRIYR